MRKGQNLLAWLLVSAAIPTVVFFGRTPNVEASLGVPACAGRPHAGPCRICSNAGNPRLPRVIDEHNVRTILLAADQDESPSAR